jgi:CRISPR/Cas system-associated endoribonuclease Cas2
MKREDKILKEKNKRLRKIRIGILGRQILTLLLMGISLGLTMSVRRHFWILDSIPKKLKKVKKKYLDRAIRRLYDSKLVEIKEDKNGNTILVLSEEGKKKILIYNIENLKLKRQSKWDGHWRLFIFDIPEKFKRERYILSKKLKEIGMYQLQKSVYVYPFECRDELEFIIEYFGFRKYVRFILAKEIDNDLHLREIFDLI